MRAVRYIALALVAGLVVSAPRVETAAQQASTPLYQRFLSNANPLELVAAKKVDRIAWTAYDREAQRLHSRRAVVLSHPPHELQRRRRHRHLPDPYLG